MSKESDIITAINHYLNYLENGNKLLFIRNNSGAFLNPKGQFYKMGKAGSPDFIIFLPKGECIHCEVKREKAKQNMAQLEWEIKIKQLGYKYFIVRSVDKISDIIKRYI